MDLKIQRILSPGPMRFSVSDLVSSQSSLKQLQDYGGGLSQVRVDSTERPYLKQE